MSSRKSSTRSATSWITTTPEKRGDPEFPDPLRGGLAGQSRRGRNLEGSAGNRKDRRKGLQDRDRKKISPRDLPRRRANGIIGRGSKYQSYKARSGDRRKGQGNEKISELPIKEVITAFPGVGKILEEYQIGCVSCAVGTCLLKDIIEIHQLPEEEGREMLARMAKAIYPTGKLSS